mmetsp:Transcript_9160/g.21300  ORF Transcript_9160/g.21300 Transcript_9160/m.21300 type:complete len:260 (-) Transcript_9160:1106-1885(-)
MLSVDSGAPMPCKHLADHGLKVCLVLLIPPVHHKLCFLRKEPIDGTGQECANYAGRLEKSGAKQHAERREHLLLLAQEPAVDSRGWVDQHHGSSHIGVVMGKLPRVESASTDSKHDVGSCDGDPLIDSLAGIDNGPLPSHWLLEFGISTQRQSVVKLPGNLSGGPILPYSVLRLIGAAVPKARPVVDARDAALGYLILQPSHRDACPNPLHRLHNHCRFAVGSDLSVALAVDVEVDAGAWLRGIQAPQTLIRGLVQDNR